MIGRLIQGSSSTTGLLSAIAVFVGLLVYATYFAFDKKASDDLTIVESVDHAADQTMAAVISPLPAGIFNSETLPANELDVAVEAKHKPKPVAVDTVSAVASNETQQQSQDIANESDLPDYAINQHFQPVYPGYATGDQMALTHRDQSQASLANQQYYHAPGDGRGRGRGRGKLNSDGEFDFSFRFKSRARMDADSDAESRLSSNLNVHNNAYYQYWNTINPAYQTYYQNY